MKIFDEQILRIIFEYKTINIPQETLLKKNA